MCPFIPLFHSGAIPLDGGWRALKGSGLALEK
jgi:hypothetical protein